MLNKSTALSCFFIAMLAVTLASCSSTGDSLCTVDEKNYDMPIADIALAPSGETGTPEETVNDSFTIVYDNDNNVTEAQDNVIRQIVFPDSGNMYTLEGVINFEFKNNTYRVTGYDLTVMGGTFGETPQTCKK